MMNLIEHPTVAALLQVASCIASLYAAILGIITTHKLPKTRHVARSASVLIVLVSVMYICTSSIALIQGVHPEGMPILPVIDMLKVMIFILVLRLFVRPCYVESTFCGMERRTKYRELI